MLLLVLLVLLGLMDLLGTGVGTLVHNLDVFGWESGLKPLVGYG